MKNTIIQRRATSSHHQLPADLPPILQRVLSARGVLSAEELEHNLSKLKHPEQLKGMDAAVDLLVQALQQQWRLLIVADFDADGATSCAVGTRALRAMGAKTVNYLVPDRVKHGYGLTPTIVELAAPLHPDLLITVDNGIASLSGVQAAKHAGMRVLVTDHHLPGRELPAADAIVNPNQPNDNFPSKNLAGVGVIFYIMLALRTRLRALGWFNPQRPEPNLAELLDLVALGTVADVVPLDYNNRILVAQGLARMRNGKACAGIQALMKVANRDAERLVSSDLGFYLGPRLNAAGRMENMSYGIECLLNDDPDTAMVQAEELDALNQERRFVEHDMQEDAQALLDRIKQQTDLPFGLCLFDENWHQGVIGILASRVKEQVHRPVIVFTLNTENPEEIKGSARSVSGVHIRDVLDAVATHQHGMITKFGGHAMAAGLSLPKANFQAFQTAFDAEVRKHLSNEDLHGVIHSDGELDKNDFTLDFAEILRNFAPWGQHFPEPVFDGHFELLEKRLLKEKHLKMLVKPVGGDYPIDAIAFNTQDKDWPTQVQQLNLAYRLDINVFRGFKTLQLMVEHIEVLA